MEPKYYWINYSIHTADHSSQYDECIDVHPFNYLQETMKSTTKKVVINNWKEISKEEYDMYNEVNN